MSSGIDGEKNYFYPWKNVKNGICKNGIPWLKIFPIKVDAHRNKWSKAKIICVCLDKNGDAQKPQLLVGSCSGTKIVLDRPINKNVLLVETEKVRFLNEDTKTNQDGRVT